MVGLLGELDEGATMVAGIETPIADEDAQAQPGPGAAMVLQDVARRPPICAVGDDLAVDHGLVRERLECSGQSKRNAQ